MKYENYAIAMDPETKTSVLVVVEGRRFGSLFGVPIGEAGRELPLVKCTRSSKRFLRKCGVDVELYSKPFVIARELLRRNLNEVSA